MTAYATAAASPALSRATEPDNRLMWDGKPGRYEVWYVTFNQRATQTGFWVRSVIEAPVAGPARAEVWFAFFDAKDPSKSFAMHEAHPISQMTSRTSPFQITIGKDSELTHGSARGKIAGDGHRAEWDLAWLPAAETHRHLPPIIYSTSFADSRLLAPNLDVPVRGRVVVDGRELVIEGEPGEQTHLWGRKHVHSWGWGHCNAFDARRGAALEALTSRLKRRGRVLPPLTLVTLYLDGEALRFSDLKNTLVNRGQTSTARYQFTAGSVHARLAGEFTCRPEDMVMAEYDDPDGEKMYCANTCVGDLRVTVWRRDRPWQKWREQARLVAPRTAHFEVAGRTIDPAIVRQHVVL